MAARRGYGGVIHLALGPLMQQGVGSTPGGYGHDGVASWASINSSKTLAVYKTDDATQNGTMADSSGNGRNGTYSNNAAVVGVRELHDYDILDSTGGTSGGAEITYASWMDDIRGAFCVFTMDTPQAIDTSAAYVLVDRDPAANRHWSMRVSNMRLTWSYQGSTSITGSVDLIADAMYTAGWWYDDPNELVRLYLNGVQVGTLSLSSWGVSGSANIAVNRNLHSTPVNGVDGGVGSVVLVNTSADSDTIPDLHDAWLGDLSEAAFTGGDIIYYRSTKV